MSEELKPCPFCGGDASEYWPNSTTKHYVQCNKCGARTALYLASHGGSAKDDWNCRISNALIEEQAARIEELEQKLRTTSLEALAISDTNNEMAMRIAELEADLACEKKESSRLDKAWHNLHERMVADEASHLDYFDASQVRMRDLFDAEAASQARLSEAVKVLEEAKHLLQDVYDGTVQADGRGDEGILDMHIVRDIGAFLTSLGKEDKQ